MLYGRIGSGRAPAFAGPRIQQNRSKIMLNLTPFLLFDGDCAAAMSFYQSCLGGDLTLTKVGDTPMKDQMPPGQHHKIVYAQLRSDAIEFSATDWLHPTRKPRQGNTVALYIHGGTYGELRETFDKLAVGADKELLDDLRDMPFGSYGHLSDQYGVHWFFQGEKKTPN
jgi:PhnB protein